MERRYLVNSSVSVIVALVITVIQFIMLLLVKPLNWDAIFPNIIIILYLAEALCTLLKLTSVLDTHNFWNTISSEHNHTIIAEIV